jgi:DNA-binding response OmpR family regulator
MMPGIDGFELCSKIRNVVDCPIIFITAKTDEGSLVNGLALGADDYICKPLGVMELRARIGAHLRREKREHVARLSLGRICFMLESRKMMIDDKEVNLTKAEYDICEFLAKNRGQIFSKEQILEKVLGYDSESSDSTIITHIKNIRTKLSRYEYMPIKTVWGIGYKWEE